MCCTGNDPRRALGSAPDPLMRSRHQLVESSGKDAQRPEGKKTVTTKVEGRKKKKGRLTLWSSLNVPTCMRVMILCVLQAICPESKTRGETAAPWRPDARRKQLCQQRRGWLRACADYRLPPPASPIMRQSITARLSQQHAARLDWQQTNRFAPCLHCKKKKKKRKRSFVAKKEKEKKEVV